MAAQPVDARIEGARRAFRRVDRQGARDDGRTQQVVDRDEVPHRERGRGLRAVEQRESLFRGEREAAQPRALQPVVGRQDLAAAFDFAHA